MKTKQWILFSLITLSNYSWTDPNQPHPADWKKFCTKYARYTPSIVISIIIGVLTGGFTRYLDDKFMTKMGILGIIMSWTCESIARESFTLSLGNDMDSCNIPNPKNGIKYSSWAASWIAYLCIPYLLSGMNDKSNNRKILD